MVGTVFKYLLILVAYTAFNYFFVGIPVVYYLVAMVPFALVFNFALKVNPFVFFLYILITSLSIPPFINWAHGFGADINVWQLILSKGLEGFLIFLGPAFVMLITCLLQNFIIKRPFLAVVCVVCFVFLIGIGGVSYYQILDSDDFVEESASCDRKAIQFVCVGVWLRHLQADEIYVTRITSNDMHSSKGKKLEGAIAYLIQDRANMHKFNKADKHDEMDSLFTTPEARSQMVDMIERGAIDGYLQETKKPFTAKVVVINDAIYARPFYRRVDIENKRLEAMSEAERSHPLSPLREGNSHQTSLCTNTFTTSYLPVIQEEGTFKQSDRFGIYLQKAKECLIKSDYNCTLNYFAKADKLKVQKPDPFYFYYAYIYSKSRQPEKAKQMAKKYLKNSTSRMCESGAKSLLGR